MAVSPLFCQRLEHCLAVEYKLCEKLYLNLGLNNKIIVIITLSLKCNNNGLVLSVFSKKGFPHAPGTLGLTLATDAMSSKHESKGN